MRESKPIWLIGDPVDHSLSPVFQNAGLGALGLPFVYETHHSLTESLPETIGAIRSGRVLGANVTLPHKGAIRGLVDRLSPAAVRAGAVNTIVSICGELEGHNTDVTGLSRALVERGLGASPPVVAAVLGAGGAARGVIVALDQLGVEQIVVLNRTESRAWAVIETMRGATCAKLDSASLDEAFAAGDSWRWSGIELIVHATSLGVGAVEGTARYSEAEATWERLPWSCLERLRTVHDVCYARGETPFIRAARACGVDGEDGLSMLLYQGVESLSMWTARRPPEALMRRALWAEVGRALP